MELRQLEAFAAVAQTLHFGRAAEQLDVAQPAVSQLVARLERDLGLALFDRSSHRVALTPAGVALLPEARATLSTARRLRRAAGALASGQAGTLRVATTTAMATRLTSALRTFAQAHPDVRVELPVLATARKFDAVQDGAVDVALFRSSPTVPRGLRSGVVWEEPFVAVLPADHAAARCDPVEPSGLATLPMVQIARSEHPTMHREVRAVCAAIGLRPRPGPAVHTAQEILATIAAGGAWALFVADDVAEPPSGVVARSLPASAPVNHVLAAWRATATGRWTEAFIDALRDGLPPRRRPGPAHAR